MPLPGMLADRRRLYRPLSTSMGVCLLLLACFFTRISQIESRKTCAPRSSNEKYECFEGRVSYLDMGVEQRIEGSDIEKKNVREILRRMGEYWVEEILTFPQYEGVRDKCKNKNDLCAFWATLNECENNRIFMMHSCAPACRLCLLAAEL